MLNPVPCITFEEYSNAIKTIKNEIAKGNTYEVNYTYDFEIPFKGNDFELFQSLLAKQKTPYNFYLKNEYDTVLSFSPELFFSLKDSHILTKPMKGTIKRGKNRDEDEQLIKFLQNDEKNRAENVMIVDLLRNDLGRIAKTGSVKVSKLFEIETHKTLHQMTSQIERI
ncbi:MAG: chorismate-binding protein [Candidatus Gastranaerophilaceae bacterium]